jgi:hypothetical protein
LLPPSLAVQSKGYLKSFEQFNCLGETREFERLNADGLTALNIWLHEIL